MPSDRSLIFTDFLVGFVDVLGYREHLRGIHEVPSDEAGRNRLIAILRETYGRVRALRDAFDGYLREASVVSTEILATLPVDKQEQFRKARAVEVRHRGFSDSFVITVPLWESSDRHVVGNASSVFAALHGIAGIYLTAMSLGVPLRGGIDVGPALDDAGEVYGPPLISAYELECKAAEYPRILVGGGLVRYLEYLSRRPTDDPLSALTVSTANRGFDLLTQDAEDGLPMLSAFSPLMHEISGSLIAECGGRALAWATAERQRFAESGNIKLSDRYRRLSEYIAGGLTPRW
jgi:hypothetical protein